MGRIRYFHKIKVTTGMTPHDFMTNIKLKRVCRVLKDEPHLFTSEPMRRLALSSISYFIKKLKEFSGTTPKLYWHRA